MRKFNFSLQGVLDLRKQLLDSLMIEISNINSKIDKLEHSLDKLKKEYSKLSYEIDDEMTKIVTISEITFYKIKLNGMLSRINKIELEIQQLHMIKENKEVELIEKNSEISGLEKLREKELDKYNKELAKAEEILIDEFVSNKQVSKKLAM